MQSVIYVIFTTTTCVEALRNNHDGEEWGNKFEEPTGASWFTIKVFGTEGGHLLGYTTDEAEAVKYCNDFNRQREVDDLDNCCILHACYTEVLALATS